MQLIFHGHACFELRGESHPTVLIDPYRPDALNGRFSLPPIHSDPSVIALTHYHEDHAWICNDWRDVPIADHSGDFGGILFQGIPAYHDTHLGIQMGIITMLRFQWGGMDIVHLGDLGVIPNDEQQALLGTPDILLLPVGGTYTLGPEEALETVRKLNPRWIVPMHGYHPNIDLPLRPVSDFVDIWDGDVHTSQASTISLQTKPKNPTVVYLDIL